MFGRLFRPATESHTIAATLYGAIVAQARNPTLYEDFGVPDTVSGRFEMVVLHVVLVLNRFGRGDASEKQVGQQVFDLYCRDMDRSLRELGIGDLGVPKRMKKMAEAYYGRAAVYGAALARRDIDGLSEAISRNVLPGQEGVARRLGTYALASMDTLAEGDILGVPVRFASLEAIAEVVT